MTLMGLVQNYHGLLIARIFLGVTEAGLYPGVAYYLTMCKLVPYGLRLCKKVSKCQMLTCHVQTQGTAPKNSPSAKVSSSARLASQAPFLACWHTQL